MKLPDSDKIIDVMRQSVVDWHRNESPSENPYTEGSFEFTIYKKNQIDTIQWHVEDEIRRPDLPDAELVRYKRKIDSLNQERTDIVEILDDLFFNLYKDTPRSKDARMNSETPAWLLDRMSILELKIYHMDEQTKRDDVDESHKKTCASKLEILLDQRKDLQKCFAELVDDLSKGLKFMKVYRQMKMYNDKKLNPSLYKASTEK